VICVYATQSGRSLVDKENFYDELAYEWDLSNTNEMIFIMGNFNGHVGKNIEDFEGIHGGNGIGERNAEGRMLLEFCDEKKLCVVNTWFKKNENRKITYRAGGNGTEIDFVVVQGVYRRYVKRCDSNSWETTTWAFGGEC